MVEPIPQWDPSLLRQIGVVLSITAVAVLGTHQIPNLKQNSRARFLIATLLAIAVIGSMNRYPFVLEAVSLVVAAGAVVIPLIVCARTFKIIVTKN